MRIFLTIIAVSLSTVARAEPNCTSAPQSKWLSEQVIKQKAVDLGHTISIFKKTIVNCYEIYGKNTAGKRIEIYYHPMTGDIVRQTAR